MKPNWGLEKLMEFFSSSINKGHSYMYRGRRKITLVKVAIATNTLPVRGCEFK